MAQAKYMVTINDDGSITTESLPVQEGIIRKATTFDIYQTSKELSSEIENHLLADRIAQRVLDALNQPKPSVSSVINNALADRGIETEKTS